MSYIFIRAVITLTLMRCLAYYIKKVIALKTTDEESAKVITILILLPCIDIFSAYTLFLVHAMILCMILDPIFLLINHIIKSEKYEFIHSIRIVPIIISLIFVTYGYFNINNVVKTQYNFSTEKHLSQDYKIAFISDLHYGTSTNLKTLKKYTEKISNENPDIVILGGDIIDEYTPKKRIGEVIKELSNIKNKYGIFFTYGNHDSSRIRFIEQHPTTNLEEELKKNNIILLKDSVYENEDIQIVGRNYSKLFGKMSSEIYENIPTLKYTIEVAHKPEEVNESARLGADLMLSGHTHAGQLWPGELIVNRVYRQATSYGYKKIYNMDLVVSSGISGWGPRVRTSRHSEFVIVNIKEK